MVVEDDDELRRAMCHVLEDAGFAAVSCAGGESALDYLRHAEPPDLILLDLVMPGVDGWRVREELRRLPRHADVPVVVVTGSRAVDRRPVDAATILRKPFTSRDLLDTVARFSRPGPTPGKEPSR